MAKKNEITISIIGVGLAGTAVFAALVNKLKLLSNQIGQLTHSLN